MNLVTVVFYAFLGLTVFSAFLLSLTKNVVYAAFMLFAVLFGMAGLYVFAGAEFLAMSQIIVYVGGILVILLFGVMLTHKLRELRPQSEIVNLIPGALLATGMFVVLVMLIQEIGASQIRGTVNPQGGDLSTVGKAILTDYLLPFEAISILLLVALTGAAYLTRKPEEKGKGEST